MEEHLAHPQSHGHGMEVPHLERSKLQIYVKGKNSEQHPAMFALLAQTLRGTTNSNMTALNFSAILGIEDLKPKRGQFYSTSRSKLFHSMEFHNHLD